ncbi:MAG TPA: enolase C-terminal domain-like protein, partial [Acidimicrobiales bacterium]|nr:enolase C-terminal domain-like protein [Acidimicrobiales bacterium]
AIKLHAWGDARRDANLAQALRAHVGDQTDLMYDGSAGFDLADAVYLGQALADAGYRWYEEPVREFSITSYKWLAERVAVPLLVAETADGVHMNVGDFIASGCATYVRTSTHYKGGFTGALRVAHTVDSFRLRAEVHGGGLPNIHLCMAIPNTTYYESLVMTNPATREPLVDSNGLVHAPTGAGNGE